tara:strand:- start:879 stop:1244 length:366 start_codon:yes stop_codon:yes gene_type:complete
MPEKEDIAFSAEIAELVTEFAQSGAMELHFSKRSQTLSPDSLPEDKQALAQAAMCELIQKSGMPVNQETSLQEFFQALVTDKTQENLRSIPSYSTTVSLNRYLIITRMDADQGNNQLSAEM